MRAALEETARRLHSRQRRLGDDDRFDETPPDRPVP
jgi:hypothetical protein